MRRVLFAVVIPIAAVTLAAQPLDRLSGKVVDARGEPMRDAEALSPAERAIGYHNPRYFYSVFHKVAGLPPNEFRRRA